MSKIKAFIRQPVVAGEPKHLPRHLMVMLFSGQHYRFAFLPPLDWAFPWVMLLLVYTVTGGVILDNGGSIGLVTGALMLLVMLGWLVYLGRFIDEDSVAYPAWYQADFACFASLYAAGLGGAAVDTWLF